MDRFDIVRRGIFRRSTPLEGFARTMLAILIPAFIHWRIDGGAYGPSFMIHLPAILMISIYLEARWAALAVIGSVIAVLVMPALLSLAPPEEPLAAILLFIVSAVVMAVIGHYLRVAVLELQARTLQVDAFNRELQHRTKNTLQMVAALAGSARKTADPEAFYDALSGRLAALASANELLSFGALDACEMTRLVDAAVAPFNVSQIEVRGQDGRVSKQACAPLMMALHELCTNATKYGALSCPEGRVTIAWHDRAQAEGIELQWTEAGGPPVEPPKAKGLGSRLLTAQGALKSVSLEFHRQGVSCRISVA